MMLLAATLASFASVRAAEGPCDILVAAGNPWCAPAWSYCLRTAALWALCTRWPQ